MAGSHCSADRGDHRHRRRGANAGLWPDHPDGQQAGRARATGGHRGRPRGVSRGIRPVDACRLDAAARIARRGRLCVGGGCFGSPW